MYLVNNEYQEIKTVPMLVNYVTYLTSLSSKYLVMLRACGKCHVVLSKLTYLLMRREFDDRIELQVN